MEKHIARDGSYQWTTIQELGTAPTQEDCLIAQPPVFGVLDGISNVHTPDIGPAFIEEGRSLGQIPGDMATQLIPRLLQRGMYSLEVLLLEVNTEIRQCFLNAGLDVNRPDTIGGAGFAFASIGEEEIRILQGGDSFAVWELKDRTRGATPNQFYQAEWLGNLLVEHFMGLHKKDRIKMWKDYAPFLARQVQELANRPGGYALLNGNPQVGRYWTDICLSRKEVVKLLLFTDGLVPFEQTASPEILCSWVLHGYRQGGIPEIKKRAWIMEEQRKGISHEDHPEYAGVAIDFLP